MMGHAFPGVITRTDAVVAPALMVMGVILFMGKVSGAHLNPAVSIAFALRRDFPWQRVPGYIVVQLAGATLVVIRNSGLDPLCGLPGYADRAGRDVATSAISSVGSSDNPSVSRAARGRVCIRAAQCPG
jgi:hypothetical protein